MGCGPFSPMDAVMSWPRPVALSRDRAVGSGGGAKGGPTMRYPTLGLPLLFSTPFLSLIESEQLVSYRGREPNDRLITLDVEGYHLRLDLSPGQRVLLRDRGVKSGGGWKSSLIDLVAYRLPQVESVPLANWVLFAGCRPIGFWKLPDYLFFIGRFDLQSERMRVRPLFMGAVALQQSMIYELSHLCRSRCYKLNRVHSGINQSSVFASVAGQYLAQTLVLRYVS